MQAGGHRFDPVRLHQFPGQFPDLVRKKENREWVSEVCAFDLFFGCLTLWIGCKARLDASSCARDGESCCVALRLGSDSARVNEVAKLCRAVVLGDESEWSSEGSAWGVGESQASDG